MYSPPEMVYARETCEMVALKREDGRTDRQAVITACMCVRVCTNPSNQIMLCGLLLPTQCGNAARLSQVQTPKLTTDGQTDSRS